MTDVQNIDQTAIDAITAEQIMAEADALKALEGTVDRKIPEDVDGVFVQTEEIIN